MYMLLSCQKLARGLDALTNSSQTQLSTSSFTLLPPAQIESNLAARAASSPGLILQSLEAVVRINKGFKNDLCTRTRPQLGEGQTFFTPTFPTLSLAPHHPLPSGCMFIPPPFSPSPSPSTGRMFISCLEVAIQVPRVYPAHKVLRSRFISSVHRLVECLGSALLPLLPAALEVLVTTQVCVCVGEGGEWEMIMVGEGYVQVVLLRRTLHSYIPLCFSSMPRQPVESPHPCPVSPFRAPPPHTSAGRRVGPYRGASADQPAGTQVRGIGVRSSGCVEAAPQGQAALPLCGRPRFPFLTAPCLSVLTAPHPPPSLLRFKESMAGLLQGLLPVLIARLHTVLAADWDWSGKLALASVAAAAVPQGGGVAGVNGGGGS